MDIAFLKPVTELGSFALVAWILWYLFNKTLPQQSVQFLEALERQRLDFARFRQEERAEFTETLKFQLLQNQEDSHKRREDFLRALDKHVDEMEKVSQAIRDEMRAHTASQVMQTRAHTRAVERLSVGLLYHDATVRGVNPEHLGSTQELLNMMRGMDEGWESRESRERQGPHA